MDTIEATETDEEVRKQENARTHEYLQNQLIQQMDPLVKRLSKVRADLREARGRVIPWPHETLDEEVIMITSPEDLAAFAKPLEEEIEQLLGQIRDALERAELAGLRGDRFVIICRNTLGIDHPVDLGAAHQ